jgi:hypothetical protein
MENKLSQPDTPSKAKIAAAAAAAAVVAAVVLITAVLPAEYGIDPLGVGGVLGLVNLSTAEGAPAGAAPLAIESGVNVPQPNVYKVDAQDFALLPGEGFEFKYWMEKGAVMVYSWKADGVLEFEFHGEPDVKPNDEYYESYVLDQAGKTEASGSFTAPSTGVHGWYWKNNGEKEVTFRLTSAGFYKAGKMYGSFGVEDIPLEDVK